MYRVESLVSGIHELGTRCHSRRAPFDFIAFLSGDDKINWMIWVVIIEMFLAISGILLVCGFLIMGAVIIQRMEALIIEGIECMRAKQVPTSKADAVYNYIGTGGRKTGLGVKIYNIRIDWSYVATFISLIITVLGLVLQAALLAGSLWALIPIS